MFSDLTRMDESAGDVAMRRSSRWCSPPLPALAVKRLCGGAHRTVSLHASTTGAVIRRTAEVSGRKAAGQTTRRVIPRRLTFEGHAAARLCSGSSFGKWLCSAQRANEPAAHFQPTPPSGGRRCLLAPLPAFTAPHLSFFCLQHVCCGARCLPADCDDSPPATAPPRSPAFALDLSPCRTHLCRAPPLCRATSYATSLLDSR